MKVILNSAVYCCFILCSFDSAAASQLVTAIDLSAWAKMVLFSLIDLSSLHGVHVAEIYLHRKV